ncbi:MAG: tRNA 2-thiouridine(34) synthase MnmA [Verrucomicrobia bacterium 13_1_20CM_4_54_11]|nr:MAG: tRNA 2-thiouridine(34) synthase MnmA [Verrucomicrobia bacterium 13_1_20CM_4_54_11]
MSGGVDSSVAGYLLREQGYDVIGVTMKVWPQDCISRAEDKCCGPQAVADARGVARALGIPHYVVDEADQFEKLVISYFSSEYQAGRTPNPCVMCNEKLKFGNLWEKAKGLGCDYIATGHYAIIEHRHATNGDRDYTRAVLRKGIDSRKDQSYFLFSLRQEQLQRALTPLGRMSKSEIRAHLGQNQFHPGGIYDLDGNFIAGHDGIEMFTIGQRKGLPGGSAQPRYVVDLDPETNRVIVGQAEDLLVEEFEIDRVNWISGAGNDDPGPRSATAATMAHEVTVKIRYNHPGTRATLMPMENQRARIRLHDPQKAVTPGQAAVFYDDDLVLGGGWICRQAELVAA